MLGRSSFTRALGAAGNALFKTDVWHLAALHTSPYLFNPDGLGIPTRSPITPAEPKEEGAAVGGGALPDGGGDRDDWGDEDQLKTELKRMKRQAKEEASNLGRIVFGHYLLGAHEWPNPFDPEGDVQKMRDVMDKGYYKPKITCDQLNLLKANGIRVNGLFYEALCGGEAASSPESEYAE
ncbi:MAG: hypothetical protein RLN62_05740 [Rickettsiales bacterium]